MGGIFGNFLSSLFGGGQTTQPGMAQQADPFAPYRTGYAQQLQQLMATPGNVTQTPGYQFGMQQGEQSLNRSFAQQGQIGSGQQQIGLEQFGQQYAGQQYNQQLSTLMQLSGANQQPYQGATAAANIQQQAYNQNQTSASNLGSTIGNLVGAFGL